MRALVPVVLLGAALVGGATLSSRAGELTVKTLDQPPPTALGASIRAVLATPAIQVLEDGKPLFTFWLRREVPLQRKPASASKWFEAMRETTLLAAVQVGQPTFDYKDNDLEAGLFTARFALLPSDGDHMGVADYPYFLLLVPAKADPKLDGLRTYKALVKASSHDTATEHPRVISLRPRSKASGQPPCLTVPAPDHKAVRVQTKARVKGQSQPIEVTFEIVVQGTGQI